MYRSGLVGGVGLGFGGIEATNCGPVCGVAGSFELHLGGMLTPRLAIMGDFWFNLHPIPDYDATTRHSLYMAALQFWPTDKLWLKGGLGPSTMTVSDNYSGYGNAETGFGIMGAGGLELLQAGNFALDAQIRLGRGFYSIGGDVFVWALMIGANWY
jgi:hypothetical protein